MQVPGPDTRVVELRVHGVLGTTPDELTDAVASVDVAGDGVGRIVQPADRLRRPVPGPVLATGDRSVPRIVEGYVWGGMTSGGAAKATWALLFPFALANVAAWMLPPAKAGSRTSLLLSATLRGLMRMSALLLTMLFVAQLSVVTLDLLAAQCFGPNSQCLSFVPTAVRELHVLRSVLALAPVGLVVLLMHRLSGVSWRVSAEKDDAPHQSALAPMLPGANVVADPDTPALRAMHVIAALSTVALLALGGPLAPAADPRWWLSAALLVLAVVGTVLHDDPSSRWQSAPEKVLRTMFGRVPRRVLMSAAAAVLATAAFLPGELVGPLPGSGSTVDLLTVALVVACLAVCVVLLPAALLARSSWKSSPRNLRPWAGGWMSAPVLMLACLLGTGFGAGLALSVRRALNGSGLQLPAAYDDIAVFWGATTILLLLTAAVAIPWVLVIRRRAARGEGVIPDEVALLHAGRPQDQSAAADAWKWAGLQRRHSHLMLLVIAGVLGVSTVLTITARIIGMSQVVWSNWLVGIGVVGLAALAVGLLRLVFLAATKREAARYLGVLCDLALFWPREAHPVVPPCYALKVVPEVADRAAEYLTDPDTRVVIVGHSQGSLLATVATARLLESLPEADRQRVGLVTAGSQLQWAYSRAFPAVVPHDSLRDLAGSLGGRWRALCRGTDSIGGPVTSWNHQVYGGMLLGVGFRPDGTEGPLPAATRGPTGALVLGSDHWLPDPQRGPFECRRWVPGVLGHADYRGDPEWDRAVAMAAGLESPSRSAALPLQSDSPTTQVCATSAEEAAAQVQLGAQGGDGGALPVEELRRGQQDESTGDSAGEPTSAAPREPESPEQARPSPAVLPEITEPRGRTAPWERGQSVRPSQDR